MSDSLQPQGLQHARLLCPPVHRSLLKFMFIELVMLSDHLILYRLLFLLPSILPIIRVFSNELALCIRVIKYWSFIFSISPSNEYSGLIFFRMDWFDLPAARNSQESSPAPQFESINSLVLNLLYAPTFTSIHEYWKDHSFDSLDLCQQSDVSAF